MRVARNTLRDVVVDSGRAAVMVDEQVLVLSELATSILDAVPEDGAIELAGITARVVAEHGEPETPGTAAELVLHQVHELAAHGVLVLVEDGDEWFRGSRRSHLDHQDGSMPGAVEAVRSALRHLVSAADAPWSLPYGVSGGDLVAAARRHHVIPFLAAHVDRLALPAGTAATVRASATQSAAGAHLLATDLATALALLERAGVRALAFKGVSLSVQAYGDLTARGAGDLDLLVPPDDLERAHAALTAGQWSHHPAYPRPGGAWAWRHLRRTGHEVSLHSDSSSIDLHWHLGPAHGGFPDFDRLWERRQVVGLAGHRVPTLSPYDALAHSAGHAAKDQWRWLRSLLDVHRLVSLPGTWGDVDRPLRGDQLLTLGIAGLMFGVPDGAPEVACEALEPARGVLDEVVDRQAATSWNHVPSPTPGTALASGVRSLLRTGAGPADLARRLGFSLLPPWLTVHEPSPHAVVAVPRALSRRTAGIVRRAAGALGRGTWSGDGRPT